MSSRDAELRRILEGEYLDPDGPEIAEIQRVRGDVERIIKAAFGTHMSFRYGGSKAKGTILLSSYDLDLLCYFHQDDVGGRLSLSEIYEGVGSVLAQHYRVEPKKTAIRLYAKDDKTQGTGLRVDVVPGRFVDDTKTIVHLHQEGGDKDYLKTDPQVHIDHVLNFEGHEEVCALKLWRVKSRLEIKQFPFELFSIERLKAHPRLSLSTRVEAVLSDIASMASPPRVEDPANRTGNDLSELFAGLIWQDLQRAAVATLRDLSVVGWSGVLMSGPVTADPRPLVEAVRTSTGSKPWCP